MAEKKKQLDNYLDNHYIHRSNWLRAAVLGANDGILSTASLAIGVAAASATREPIILATLAGLVAGALSMAAGEYVSVSSQTDIEKADIEREIQELKEMPEIELQRLAEIYEKRGLKKETALKVAEELTKHDALGAHVTLFSRSTNKIEDAKALGADQVIISTDEAQMESVMKNFDLLIDTVPYAHDLNPYVGTLNVNGTLVVVGYLGPLDPMLVTVPMIMGRKSVAGSLIGGIAETQELLDFCGKHNITSDIEVIDIQNINEAYERMLKSDVKYRFVIDMKSLKS